MLGKSIVWWFQGVSNSFRKMISHRRFLTSSSRQHRPTVHWPQRSSRFPFGRPSAYNPLFRGAGREGCPPVALFTSEFPHRLVLGLVLLVRPSTCVFRRSWNRNVKFSFEERFCVSQTLRKKIWNNISSIVETFLPSCAEQIRWIRYLYRSRPRWLGDDTHSRYVIKNPVPKYCESFNHVSLLTPIRLYFRLVRTFLSVRRTGRQGLHAMVPRPSEPDTAIGDSMHVSSTYLLTI